MRQIVHSLPTRTRGRSLTEITRGVRDWIGGSGMNMGLLTLFIRHISASLLIERMPIPRCRRIWSAFSRAFLVSYGDSLCSHSAEGPDDMPAHIRAALTQRQVSIPLRNSALALGTWQGMFVYEYRSHGHTREVALHLLGEP